MSEYYEVWQGLEQCCSLMVSVCVDLNFLNPEGQLVSKLQDMYPVSFEFCCREVALVLTHVVVWTRDWSMHLF